MTRSLPFRFVLSVLAITLASRTARPADDELTVLKADAGGVPPRKMLHEYLLGQTKIQFDARRKAVAALASPEDIKKRQTELKAKFIEALGGFPEKTPLNAKVVGTAKFDGFRIERVIYESRPNHHVTANLYLPEGKGPFPAVLVPCGHSTNGKIGYQRVCLALAKQGFAAMSYDPIGQGERHQILEPPGKPFTSSTNEHTLVMVGSLLVGECTASYRVWDGIRSIDYLCSRPEIDAKRIGCTGSSGGGTLTSYLMALDERVAAAAPSCYVTSLERLFATIGPQDGEQNIPGQVAFGMEHADYITMRAPKPTLLLCATQDFFDIQGSWTTFREAKQVYGVAGFGERVDLFEFNTKHGYPKQQREAMLRFMGRWLLGKDEPVVEGDAPTLKDDELRCTRTGEVLEDLKGRSAFDFIAQRDKELTGQRAKSFAGKKPEEARAAISRVLGISEKLQPRREEVGTIDKPAYVIHKLVLQTAPGIQVPALHFKPKKPATDLPLILYVHDHGKSANLSVCEALVGKGQEVLALDLRGMGETAPSPPSTKPSLFGNSWRETFLSLHLSRPLLTQRVEDVLAALNTLEQKGQSPKVHVIGVGAAGPIVLHAAALDARISQVTLEKSLISWSSVAQTAITYDQLANVVPGALKVYDLPDLASSLAPRPLTIRAPVDAAQKPVTQAVLDKAYAPCKDAYTKQKSEKLLVLQAEP
jgi:dienelactone hydrolase